MKDSLEILAKNPHFKRVIIEGYFEDKAIALVSALASPNREHPDCQKAIQKQIEGIGALQQHFNIIKAEGSLAEKAVHENEIYLERLLEEDGE